jgi:GT2 family glycosyltransferase
VVIAVLTWNGYETSRACLDSLAILDEASAQVVVVDNGSLEREGERLAAEFGPNVRSLRLDPNRGVAGGYNAGIRYAADAGATHVLLMNNDTIVRDPRLLAVLCDAAGPDVGAVAPVTLNRDGSIYSAGGRLSYWTGLSGHRRVVVGPGAYEAPWLDGPCLLVSLRAIAEVGAFDEAMGAYWEDVEWCLRANRRRWRCLVDPRTSIVHLRGGTNPSSTASQMDLRNGLYVMRRHGSRAQLLAAICFFVLIRAPSFVARRTFRPPGFLAAAAMVGRALRWHLRDAVSRRSWRIPPIESSSRMDPP